MKCIGFILLFLAQFAARANGKACLEVRGVVDVGSSGTKVRVARVDSCLQVIEAILFEASEKVSFSADLSEQKRLGKPEAFSLEIQARGEAAVVSLLARAKERTAVRSWVGFATSAFRTAKNGVAVLSKFSEKTGVPFRVIPQTLEAKLGFIAGVAASVRRNQNHTLVWDVGGGSQQFVGLSQAGELQVAKLENAASDRMKEIILHEIKKVTDPLVTTPNPVGRANLIPALERATTLVQGLALPISEVKEIIGVGGVLSASNPKMLGKKDGYSQEDLERAVNELSDSTDEAINARLGFSDPYVETSVSNLILTLGVMKKFGFKKIRVSRFGTTEGALVYPDFWRSK